MCRFLKTAFLGWPAEIVGHIFGEAILEFWKDACEKLDLVVASVVARPLYVCTSKLDSFAQTHQPGHHRDNSGPPPGHL